MQFVDIVKPNETWDMIDSSKLGSFLECPRKYFYEYVLGWRSTFPNNHLTFGIAWHLGVEHLLLNKYSNDALKEAINLFYVRYRQDLSDETDAGFVPKDPKRGIESLLLYRERFYEDVFKYDVLFTELSGTVMLSASDIMYFNIDAILRDKDGFIIVLDHKTSQRHMSYWSSSYNLSTQMLTYIHAVRCMYGADTPTKGARIRGTFFYKAKPAEFEETTVEKTPDQLNSWLSSTHYWYQSLRQEMEILTNDDNDNAATMSAFPMNEKSCFLYGRPCQFFDYCDAYANPIQHCAEPPIGFKTEYWNPSTREETRYTVDLTNQIVG